MRVRRAVRRGRESEWGSGEVLMAAGSGCWMNEREGWETERVVIRGGGKNKRTGREEDVGRGSLVVSTHSGRKRGRMWLAYGVLVDTRRGDANMFEEFLDMITIIRCDSRRHMAEHAWPICHRCRNYHQCYLHLCNWPSIMTELRFAPSTLLMS